MPLFRHYLLRTSQLTGSFYSARGRRRILREDGRPDALGTTDTPPSAARNRHQSNTLRWYVKPTLSR
jgi:hypothetical protein